MAFQLCVTISQADKQFLNENKFSPSKLLQQKINEIREHSEITPETIRELNRKIKVLRENTERAMKFLEDKGVLEQFLKEQGAL